MKTQMLARKWITHIHSFFTSRSLCNYSIDLWQRRMDARTATKLIKEEKDPLKALEIYHHFRKCNNPNGYMLNTLVKKLCDNNKIDKLLHLVNDVVEYNITESYTVRMLFNASIKRNNSKFIDSLFESMLKSRSVISDFCTC
jgi:hypothetical protein